MHDYPGLKFTLLQSVRIMIGCALIRLGNRINRVHPIPRQSSEIARLCATSLSARTLQRLSCSADLPAPSPGRPYDPHTKISRRLGAYSILLSHSLKPEATAAFRHICGTLHRPHGCTSSAGLAEPPSQANGPAHPQADESDAETPESTDHKYPSAKHSTKEKPGQAGEEI